MKAFGQSCSDPHVFIKKYIFLRKDRNGLGQENELAKKKSLKVETQVGEVRLNFYNHMVLKKITQSGNVKIINKIAFDEIMQIRK